MTRHALACRLKEGREMESRLPTHRNAKRVLQVVVLGLVMLGAMLSTVVAVAGMGDPANRVSAAPIKGIVIPNGNNNSPTPTCQPGTICDTPTPTPDCRQTPCDTATATETPVCNPATGAICDTATYLRAGPLRHGHTHHYPLRAFRQRLCFSYPHRVRRP
jgi:hypothetical protein